MASTNGQNLPIGIADSGTGSGPRVNLIIIYHNYMFFSWAVISYIVKQLISRPPGDTTFILIYVASICKYSCKYLCHMHFLIVSNWKTIIPSRCNMLGSYLKTPATPATPATRYLFMKSAAWNPAGRRGLWRHDSEINTILLWKVSQALVVSATAWNLRETGRSWLVTGLRLKICKLGL